MTKKLLTDHRIATLGANRKEAASILGKYETNFSVEAVVELTVGDKKLRFPLRREHGLKFEFDKRVARLNRSVTS